MPSPRARALHLFFLERQDEIVAALESRDGTRFGTDEWEREGGGGGRSRVLSEGLVIEKGGVNVSLVHGEIPEPLGSELPGLGRSFVATGLSLVLHPRSPRVPTVHMNFRYLESEREDGATAWFGGGA